MFQPKEIGYFKRILRETETEGVKLIPAPSPSQVIEAAAKQVGGAPPGLQGGRRRACWAKGMAAPKPLSRLVYVDLRLPHLTEV